MIICANVFVLRKRDVLQGVPKDMTDKLPASDWVMSALEVLGGKGGGKPTTAQGQGPNWQKIDEAMEVAKQMASLKL